MLKLGCAKIDITPSKPAFQRGYGDRKDLSKGIADRLHAGVLLFQQGRAKRLVITLDCEGVRLPVCNQIYADLRREFGFKEEQIFLSSSHTHFGAGFDGYFVINPGGSLAQGFHPAEKDQYPRLIKGLVAAVKESAASMEAVAVEEASIHLPSLLFNRRTVRKSDGKVDTNYMYPDNPEPYIFQPTDDELAVWRFRAAAGIKAIVGRFSCHPVTGGFEGDHMRISADYPGQFQTLVEKYFGCPGFFMLGSAGDAVPLQRYDNSRSDIGEVMARSIRMAERTFRKAGDFQLDGRLLHVPVVLRAKCPRKGIEARLKRLLEEYNGKPKDILDVIGRIDAAVNTVTYPEDRIEMPLRLLRLGSKVLVGMPFEVLTEIGLKLKAACPNAELISITGGYEGYLPLAHEYPRGGYEASLGARFNKRAGDDFLAAAIKAVREFEGNK